MTDGGRSCNLTQCTAGAHPRFPRYWAAPPVVLSCQSEPRPFFKGRAQYKPNCRVVSIELLPTPVSTPEATRGRRREGMFSSHFHHVDGFRFTRSRHTKVPPAYVRTLHSQTAFYEKYIGSAAAPTQSSYSGSTCNR